MTTSEMAFRLSMDSLFEQIPKGFRACYFWTITAPDVITPSEFSKRWHHFSLLVKRAFPNMPWIRVYEVHPGEEGDFNGHGMHAHAVFPDYRRVEVISELAVKCGLGRVWVKPLPRGKAKNYLTKYLSKMKRALVPYLKGKRLWACINFPQRTVIRNVLRFSLRSYMFKKLLGSSNWLHKTKFFNEKKYGFDFHKIRGLWGYQRFLAVKCVLEKYLQELSEHFIKGYQRYLTLHGIREIPKVW